MKSKIKKRCHGCRKGPPLDLHHKSYKRFKNERLTDLVLLCRSCHNKVHKYRAAHPKKDLWSVTRIVTKRIRWKKPV